MNNRLIKGFIVISFTFILGCGGLMRKTKTFIKSPFGSKGDTSVEMSKKVEKSLMETGKDLFQKGEMKQALKRPSHKFKSYGKNSGKTLN